MKNKKLIIIVSAIALISIVAAVIILKPSRLFYKSSETVNVPAENFTADFLSPNEKQSLDITTDLKVQAIKRDEQGEVMVYKIIREDKDIINPANIKPISPRVNQ
ncbi:MAG: hypothetical protein WCN88_03800 [Candidatus Falkowbacteria bacterium]